MMFFKLLTHSRNLFLVNPQPATRNPQPVSPNSQLQPHPLSPKKRPYKHQN